jgi:hypothetical protein
VVGSLGESKARRIGGVRGEDEERRERERELALKTGAARGMRKRIRGRWRGKSVFS